MFHPPTPFKHLAATALGALVLMAKPVRAEDKPWQLNLSLAPTKGVLTVGRDFGLRYVGLGLSGLAYSSRDGLEIGPSINFQKRFTDPYAPYLGLAAIANYSQRDGGTWETPFLVPSVGKEFRFRYVYLHAEVYLATPMDSKFMADWSSPGVGFGMGVPF